MLAYLGLGSNLGDPLANLRRAVASTPDVTAVSQVYRTSPVGGPPGQADYLNMVVVLDTELDPRQLLDLAHRLEAEAGRVRTVVDGPRTLDVDVLLVGDLELSQDDLVVPHPRMWQRRFVLAPLADVAPGLVSRDQLDRAGGTVVALGRLVQY